MGSPGLQLSTLGFEHLPEAIEVHIVAFPNARSTRLGRRFLRRMYSWFIHHYPELSIVAISDSRVAGFMVGSLGEYTSRLFIYTLPEILLTLVTSPRLLFSRDTFYEWRKLVKGSFMRTVGRKQRAVQPGAEKFVAAASLAVAPEFRGAGIPLMIAFQEASESTGAAYITSSVNKSNVRLIEVYQRLGYELIPEAGKGVRFNKRLV